MSSRGLNGDIVCVCVFILGGMFLEIIMFLESNKCNLHVVKSLLLFRTGSQICGWGNTYSNLPKRGYCSSRTSALSDYSGKSLGWFRCPGYNAVSNSLGLVSTGCLGIPNTCNPISIFQKQVVVGQYLVYTVYSCCLLSPGFPKIGCESGTTIACTAGITACWLR